MQVFLTGATGYIGGAVAEALTKAGYAGVGLARSDDQTPALAAKGLGAHRGDLRDPASLAEGARNADAVIHTALAAAAMQGKWTVPPCGRHNRRAFSIQPAVLSIPAVAGCWATPAIGSRTRTRRWRPLRWWLGARPTSNWCWTPRAMACRESCRGLLWFMDGEAAWSRHWCSRRASAAQPA